MLLSHGGDPEWSRASHVHSCHPPLLSLGGPSTHWADLVFSHSPPAAGLTDPEASRPPAPTLSDGCLAEAKPTPGPERLLGPGGHDFSPPV